MLNVTYISNVIDTQANGCYNQAVNIYIMHTHCVMFKGLFILFAHGSLNVKAEGG